MNRKFYRKPFTAGLSLLLFLLPASTIVEAWDTDSSDCDYDIPTIQITWNQNDSILTPQIYADDGSIISIVETTADDTDFALRQAPSLPSSYDLRDVDGVCYTTSVKDQGSTGMCWAYSTISACESNILMQGLSIGDDWGNGTDDIDLSESSLCWYIYTEHNRSGDFTSGDYVTLNKKGQGGGNAAIASFALASGTGLELDKYAAVSDWSNGYSEYNRYTSYYRMDSSDIIWSLATGSESVIKEWIMETGAVSACYYSSDQYYDNGTSSAYYQNVYDEDSANHAILIIGWDDDYAKENFCSKNGSQPSSDGAWLCQNSWGDDDTYEGYFWMSYEELSLCELARYQMVEQSGDTVCYQYDGGLSYGGMCVDAAANVFTAEADGELTEVMFPILSTNTDKLNFTISVYLLDDDAEDPTDGTRVLHQTRTTTYSGYKSVALNQAVTLERGDRFSIVLSLSNMTSDPNASDPYISVEVDTDGTASTTCSNLTGQSYLKTDSEWVDMEELRSKYSDYHNVALKAIVQNTSDTTNTTQLEQALALAEDAGVNSLFDAYTTAVSVLADSTAEQWEIDNAAENLLALLEKYSVISYPVYEYAAYDYTLGDVNENGEIDSRDGYLCLVEFAENSAGSIGGLLPAQVAAGDIDGDGYDSISDAYQIQCYFAETSAGNHPSCNTE